MSSSKRVSGVFKLGALSLCILFYASFLHAMADSENENKEPLLAESHVIEMQELPARVLSLLSERNKKLLQDDYAPDLVSQTLQELENDADYQALLAIQHDAESSRESRNRRNKIERNFMVKALLLLAKKEKNRADDKHEEMARYWRSGMRYICINIAGVMLIACAYPIIQAVRCLSPDHRAE